MKRGSGQPAQGLPENWPTLPPGGHRPLCHHSGSNPADLREPQRPVVQPHVHVSIMCPRGPAVSAAGTASVSTKEHP